ncbi:MAG: hypothetical protein GKR98_02200 [Boseongicola sp.]|nr:MAG: hypothetical protein GKR98_02200 [Boseongicola sp.]
MLVNVVDLRERTYRWSSVLAVMESALKDNEASDSDQVEAGQSIDIDYAERSGISVREAVQWAEQAGAPVTLYLYDMDGKAAASDE